MSQTYIPGIVDNIRSDSTPYTPIIEAITNSLDAINKSGREDGQIDITLERDNVLANMGDNELPEIKSVIISDNGIGFTDDNRLSFDTVYSPQKKDIGGKGFGRFFFLRHFDAADVESYYSENDKLMKRTFEFGKEYDVVVNEEMEEQEAFSHDVGSTLRLKNIHRGKFDKDTEAFAHRISERLLSYFADDNYKCPKIIIHDGESDHPIVLNDLIGNSNDSLIQLKASDQVEINGKVFNYKMFKILRPRNQKSKIVLTARNQSVTDVTLETYVPEFASEFIEAYKNENGEEETRNYIVHFYVQGDYLNEQVTTERDGFNFDDLPDSMGLFPVGKLDIERAMANVAKEKFGEEVRTRFENKKEKIESYAEDNIWYKPYVEHVDLDTLKMNPSKSDMELILHKVKYDSDLEIKRKIDELTSDNTTYQDGQAAADEIIKEAKQASISDLAQYVAFRKAIIELLKTTIKRTADGTYSSEKELHDIIFPTKTSTDDTPYDGHNLWVLDERLTFTTQHVSSDQNVFQGQNNDRPDIAAFHYIVGYREVNESHSPISIFEFKKPGIHDFVNQSAKEDPFDQIKRYVQAIKNGELKDIDGLQVQVADSTPFYGYIVADSDKSIEDWLSRENFKKLPDGEGWFYNHDALNLRVEFITWQKLIKDAEIRHRKFFELLGAS